MKELWDAFTEESATTKQDRLLLSVAVSAHQQTINEGYQAWRLSKYGIIAGTIYSIIDNKSQVD